MPTYDYRCNGCEHEFELFQSMSAGVKKKCPECGKLQLERLIGTGAAVLFKGSGFYETDYRSDNYKSAEKAEKGQAAKKAAKKHDDAKAAKEKPSPKAESKAVDKPAPKKDK